MHLKNLNQIKQNKVSQPVSEMKTARFSPESFAVLLPEVLPEALELSTIQCAGIRLLVEIYGIDEEQQTRTTKVFSTRISNHYEMLRILKWDLP